jgi:glutaredoxin-related protein
MFDFLKKLFGRPKEPVHDKRLHKWSESEPSRVRTFISETETCCSEGAGLSVSTTTELATSRQEKFIADLGYDSSGLSKSEATQFIHQILRPINYALRKTFKNIDVLERQDLRSVEVALSNWNYIKSIPRYGPFLKASEIENDLRPLTKEERMRVTDICFQNIPEQSFRLLVSNGVKKYKDSLVE